MVTAIVVLQLMTGVAWSVIQLWLIVLAVKMADRKWQKRRTR